MTAPRRSGAEQATTRGVIVLLVAVVLGLGLLVRSHGLVGSTATAKSRSTTTTTITASTTTPSTLVPPNTNPQTQTTAHPDAQVKVLVVNASGQTGVGTKNKTTLTAAGYTTVEVKNGPAAPITTIYYQSGYQADAAAVRTAVSLPTAQLALLPATPIIADASTNNVTLVLGANYKA